MMFDKKNMNREAFIVMGVILIIIMIWQTYEVIWNGK